MAQLAVVDPAGRLTRREIRAAGPGHFEGILDAPQTGLYRVAARVAEHAALAHVLRTGETELARRTPSRLSEWLDAGLLEVWAAGTARELLAPRRDPWPIRVALLLAALLVYLATIVREKLSS